MNQNQKETNTRLFSNNVRNQGLTNLPLKGHAAIKCTAVTYFCQLQLLTHCLMR